MWDTGPGGCGGVRRLVTVRREAWRGGPGWGSRNWERSAAVHTGEREALTLRGEWEEQLYLYMVPVGLSRMVLLAGFGGIPALVHVNRLYPEVGFVSGTGWLHWAPWVLP